MTNEREELARIIERWGEPYEKADAVLAHLRARGWLEPDEYTEYWKIRAEAAERERDGLREELILVRSAAAQIDGEHAETTAALTEARLERDQLVGQWERMREALTEGKAALILAMCRLAECCESDLNACRTYDWAQDAKRSLDVLIAALTPLSPVKDHPPSPPLDGFTPDLQR